MNISEEKLRRIIRETILEASNPNEPTSLGGRLAPKAIDKALSYIPGSSYVKDAADTARTFRDARSDREIADSNTDLEFAGFKRACRDFESRVRESHRSGQNVDLVNIFNTLLVEYGVSRYHLVDDSQYHAGEFEAFED